MRLLVHLLENVRKGCSSECIDTGLCWKVVVNDLYAFDPNEVVDITEFEGVIQRAFRQPAAGLGFDDSSVAHMWRTLIWPNNFL